MRTRETGRRRAGAAGYPPALLDRFVAGPMTVEAVRAAARKFRKALVECALSVEMSHAPGETSPHRHVYQTQTLMETGAALPQFWRDALRFHLSCNHAALAVFLLSTGNG